MTRGRRRRCRGAGGTASSYRLWRPYRVPPARTCAGQDETPRSAGVVASANARSANRVMGVSHERPAEALPGGHGISVPSMAALSGAAGPYTRGAGRDTPRSAGVVANANARSANRVMGVSHATCTSTRQLIGTTRYYTLSMAQGICYY